MTKDHLPLHIIYESIRSYNCMWSGSSHMRHQTLTSTCQLCISSMDLLRLFDSHRVRKPIAPLLLFKHIMGFRIEMAGIIKLFIYFFDFVCRLSRPLIASFHFIHFPLTFLLYVCIILSMLHN